MLVTRYRKSDRCLTLLMSVVFATIYTIPINAQTNTPRPSQSPTIANTATSTVKAFAGQLAIFLGHEKDITSVVFSPDGRYLLTASQDKTARLWDINGNLLQKLLGHNRTLTSAVFSPDGRYILTASEDKTARLWDINGNLLQKFVGHKEYVQNVVFSPNSQQILTIGWDKTLLWDTKGNLLAEFQGNKVNGSLISPKAVFSPNGSQILTVTSDGMTRLWDSSGNLLVKFQGHKDKSLTATFSPDGRQILTASIDKTALLWNTKGNLLAKFQGHKEPVLDTIFSPDGKQILTAGKDGTARVWDTKGNAIAVFGKYGNSDSSSVWIATGFSPNGQQILTSSRDGTARVWDTKGNLQAQLRGHHGIVQAVFSPDGRHVITISGDKIARLWDVSAASTLPSEQITTRKTSETLPFTSQNKAQLAIFQGHKESVGKAVFSPDGKQILTTSIDKIPRLWDTKGNLLTEFQVLKERLNKPEISPDSRHILAIGDKTAYLWDIKGNLLIKFPGHKHSVISAVFSPDGSQILTASLDDTARLWDIKGNLLTVFQGHKHSLRSAVFSPDGSQILTTSFDKTIRLWDINGNLLTVFQYDADQAKFSPDGSHILTHSTYLPRNVRLWNTKGNLLTEFQEKEDADIAQVYSALFSPDGRQILIASGNGNVCLWDSKGNLLAKLQGHDYRVNSALFSPDGRHILTAGADKTARLWDTKGNLLAIFRGHEKEVNSAVFSSNGRHILTASVDKTARLWDISTGIKVSAAEVAFIKGNQLSSQGTVESRKLALPKLAEAAALYRADKNYAQAALTLLSIGKIHANLGQFQSALDSYNRALNLSKQGNAKAEQAEIFNNLGQLYKDLGDTKTAVAYYNQALPLLSQLNDQEALATTRSNLGNLHATTEQWENALQSYNQALIISRPKANLAAEANALTGIGNIYSALKEWETALNAYNQALLISRYLKDKVTETLILNQLGKVHTALRQNSTALEYYNQSLSLSEQLGYKTEEANILYNQAIINHQQNNLQIAKTKIETAINIIESLRIQIASKELRQSYFASNQDYYQFYIDLLMQLHQQNPNEGYDAEALHISERSRARSLLELIVEANADIRTGVDAKLLQAEQDLKQQLNQIEKRRIQLLSGTYKPEQQQALEIETNQLLAKYQDIQTQIRINSPRYAAITQPQPLKLAEIQQQLLDENTILLEYYLGKKKSYLWGVSKTQMTTYELPENTKIENLVKIFRHEIVKPASNQESIARVSAQLTNILLEPIAEKLETKRLIIVGNGALQYLPFAALSIPNSQKYQPLIINHEIVTLPSASTLSLIRTQQKNRKPATKTLAILADPVFIKDDQRLINQEKSVTTNTNNLEDLALKRAADNTNIKFERLPFTRKEAEKIVNLLPKNQTLQIYDFAANRDFITNKQLNKYQILHFATHGILDSVQPELSGLVLSLFNEKGEAENGFLRLHDIFNLNLSAELVVLSACQTGLGKEIKGEGLIGLTTGFMYAGSSRVITSLWNVDDQGTSILMEKLYQQMLKEGLKPAAAMRKAQLEMLTTQWSKPYFWAAFTVQGD